ncbi:hypothetical protein PQC36_gp108 [Proteus phage Vb_PmiP-P59]|uniref:Uncharacterized protein n=3 Tax=Privateervirus TaxID=2843440 RepID=A0A7L7SGH4_9CAUD|nr:hypothetical protein HWD17_gp093 [Proteus phage Privateer]YP_010672235.1 hypothetical protein PQC36_gp108 [Proteus phage Vb_PmiP-P59]YP_010672352.1 hypothetical protein PQC37_gp089 [Proteus phage 3H10_20]QIN94886.1 hypothetical protein CPT_Privateer_093 [Proteus phage Privateer]QMV48278.1 hypothetical protein [Proteus phage Vb_PmiP-P59]QOC54875.1 hypothetical protein [Proteus phage 3H10_20]
MEYSIALKNGVKGKVSNAPCFGKMASSGWGGVRDRRHQEILIGKDNKNLHSFIEFSIGDNISNISNWENNLGGFDFLSADDITFLSKKEKAEKNLIKHLKAIFDDLKIYQGCISVHPILKVVRAHIKNNKADKIITGLFLARNLTTCGTMSRMYNDMINWGYRPSFSAVVAHLLFSNVGAFSNSYSVQWVGETNWISPLSFGKQSLIRLLSGDFTDDAFVQEEWKDQGYYKRDDGFSGSLSRFNGRGRKLIDCLSVERDTHFLDNPSRRGDHRRDGTVEIEIVDHRGFKIPRLVVEMESFLVENNINPFA